MNMPRATIIGLPVLKPIVLNAWMRPNIAKASAFLPAWNRSKACA